MDKVTEENKIEIPLELNNQLLTAYYQSLANEIHLLQEFQNKVVAIARQDCPPEYKEKDLLNLLEDYRL